MTSAPAKKVMKDGVGIDGRMTMWAKQKEDASSKVKLEEPVLQLPDPPDLPDKDEMKHAMDGWKADVSRIQR